MSTCCVIRLRIFVSSNFSSSKFQSFEDKDEEDEDAFEEEDEGVWKSGFVEPPSRISCR